MNALNLKFFSYFDTSVKIDKLLYAVAELPNSSTKFKLFVRLREIEFNWSNDTQSVDRLNKIKEDFDLLASNAA